MKPVKMMIMAMMALNLGQTAVAAERPKPGFDAGEPSAIVNHGESSVMVVKETRETAVTGSIWITGGAAQTMFDAMVEATHLPPKGDLEKIENVRDVNYYNLERRIGKHVECALHPSIRRNGNLVRESNGKVVLEAKCFMRLSDALTGTIREN